VERSDHQFSKNVLTDLRDCLRLSTRRKYPTGKSHPNVASYPFLILAPALSCAGTLYRGIIATGRARTGWLLFASALFLWTAGISLSCWEDVADHVPEAAAWFSDFSYFLYGAPLLLILSLPSASERVPLFLWLDAIQGALTACLIYVDLFGASPFLNHQIQPVSSLSSFPRITLKTYFWPALPPSASSPFQTKAQSVVVMPHLQLFSGYMPSALALLRTHRRPHRKKACRPSGLAAGSNP